MDQVVEYLPFAAVVMAGVLSIAVQVAQRTHHSGRIRDEGARRQLRDRVLNRLSSGMPVAPDHLDRFRNSLGLTQHQAKLALDGLYSENLTEQLTSDVISNLDTLLKELEEKQSFDDLPAGFRPSLIRIKKSLADPETAEGNAILTPIINGLRSFVELEREAERMKRHRNIAYGISVVSLVIGLVSIYLTPSVEDFEEVVANYNEEARGATAGERKSD